MSEKTIHDVLHDLQVALKVPKDQWNDFGKYKYRNAESILQSAKALAPEGVHIDCNVTPEVVKLVNGDAGTEYMRVICKATASIASKDGMFTATAYAVEPESKKGMDSAQVSGATISYAKKYALANLFAIDGTEDSDAEADEKPAKARRKADGSEVEKAARKAAQAAAAALETERAALVETFKRYKVALIGRGAEMDNEQIAEMVEGHLGKPRSEWLAVDYADARAYLEEQIGAGE